LYSLSSPAGWMVDNYSAGLYETVIAAVLALHMILNLETVETWAQSGCRKGGAQGFTEAIQKFRL
jgi:hypothetical protein